MEWNLEKVLKLIDLYRQYPCLWDSKIDDYKCKGSRNEAWTSISKTLGVERFEIERKMRNLMSQFSRECKRYRKAKLEGRNYRSTWFGFKKLLFLKCKNKQDICGGIVGNNNSEEENESLEPKVFGETYSNYDTTSNEKYDNNLSSKLSQKTHDNSSYPLSYHKTISTNTSSSRSNNNLHSNQLLIDEVHHMVIMPDSDPLVLSNVGDNGDDDEDMEYEAKRTQKENEQQMQQKQLFQSEENPNSNMDHLKKSSSMIFQNDDSDDDVKLNQKHSTRSLLHKSELNKNFQSPKKLRKLLMKNRNEITNTKLNIVNKKKITSSDFYNLALKALISSDNVGSSNTKMITNTNSESVNDRFEHIARNYSLKLKEMNHKQRIIAEKIISDILFYGEIEQLTVSTAHKISNLLTNPKKD